MPPVIVEIDVTVLAAEVGDAMSAGLGVRLRHRPIRPTALLEAFSKHEVLEIRPSAESPGSAINQAT